MTYMFPAPGTDSVKLTLTDNAAVLTGNVVVAALQDMTISNSNDTFTWSQLDSASKFQIATTSTNSVSCNLVIDETTFFGTGGTTTVANVGLAGLSKRKDNVGFSIELGDGRTATGNGYITGIAPAISADSPVWVTPCTIAVSGDITWGGA